MASPASLKNYSFQTLASLQDSIFADDYCFDFFETWKFKGKTTKNGKFEYEAKVKDEKTPLSDKLVFQFPFSKYWAWTGIKRNGDIKVHFDLGNVQVKNKQINLFTNIKTSSKFSDFIVRFGGNYWTKNLELSSRVEHNSADGSTFFTKRAWVNQDSLFYASVVTAALKGLFLTKYDAVVGYSKDDKSAYLIHKSNKDANKDNFGLGTIEFMGVWKRNKQTFGIDVTRSSKGVVKVTGAALTEVCKDLSVKGKVTNQGELTLSTKYKLNDLVNFTGSGQLQLAQGAAAFNFQNFTPFPLGLKFEVNM